MLARSGPPLSKEDFRKLTWRPGSESAAFLRLVHRRALGAGGLRFSGLENPPLESLRLHGAEGEDWAAAFPIVRMNERSHLTDEEHDFRSPVRRRILIYVNPAGEPALPEAAREGQEILALLEAAGPGLEVRYIARNLSEHEWFEAVADADVVLYFGHGRNIGGYPAIPLGARGTVDGYAPFFPGTVLGGPEPSLFVFAACLPDAGELSFDRQGTFVYPVCRIADRPSRFVRDFCEQLFVGESAGSPALAFHTACRRDREHGDIRRFLFRLQG